jgi:aryl sulfotransferase
VADSIKWPVKTREIHDAYFDSTRWNDFAFRDGDVVIAAYPKAGTNWTQQIVLQLIHGPRGGLEAGPMAPRLDMRFVPFELMRDGLAAQTHRRCIRTHLPLDALVFSPKARYLVVGRDVRDIVWSAHNHHSAYTDAFLAQLNGPAGRPGAIVTKVDRDVHAYYLHFLEHDELPGFGFQPLWPHIRGWWAARRLPNVLMLHYANLIANLGGEIRRLAAFLDLEVDDAQLPRLLERCSIGYMRQAADGSAMDAIFKDGAASFFNKGTNGRWKDVLSPAEIAACDAVAAQRLTPDCAHWLNTGQLPD